MVMVVAECPLRKVGLLTSSTIVPTALAFFKSQLPDWPNWAMNLMLVMAYLLGLVIYGTSTSSGGTDEDEEDETTTTTTTTTTTSKTLLHQEQRKAFYSFRRKYIAVYIIVMLADWMQGTHMYTLYLSYNVNISALFLTGFLSGAIFAPFLGSAVDQYGRKASCILYCLLEVIINLLEHCSTNFSLLLLGRILGGISTNLLFTAFESWMTTEHRKLHLPEEWLQQTYSAASVANGTTAIVAGILSQLLEDRLGHIGPFQGAIVLTILALLLVAFTWNENYGHHNSQQQQQQTTTEKEDTLLQQFLDGWTATLQDSYILRIGLIQALSEGAMYTFVFMWVPTLLALNPPNGLPTGCVFSSLMMSITIGGLLFRPLEQVANRYLAPFPHVESEVTATIIYALAGIAMFFPACILGYPTLTPRWNFEFVLASFVIMECCVGLFMPVQGTLRSKYVPDQLQGAILNIFRLPLNIIVVLGTYATDVLPHYQVFGIVSSCFFCATLVQATLITPKQQPSTTTSSITTTTTTTSDKKIQ
jgi:MFS family permease